MKDIILLGSTGSVGRKVLDVVRSYPELFRLKAISSNENISLLKEQAKEFAPSIVAVGDKEKAQKLKGALPASTKLTAGAESLEELAQEASDIIFIAISGTAALKPLIAALKAGRTVALASKEPVVSAGSIIKDIMSKNASQILPVDSEHSAIKQCLEGRKPKDVRTLYITGSGGSLKDVESENFDTLSIGEVLAHPKWDMGKKITVDSATLMNKGLEVIEARWLFDIAPEKIKVIIHPEAVIHSMVEFLDGTITAAMFSPDMRFPILKALSYPEVLESDFPKVDFPSIKNFSFLEPDRKKFPALELAFRALRSGGTMPAVLNSANEASVKLFLEGKIKFTDIIKIVEKVINIHKIKENPSLEEVLDSEKWALEEVLKVC